MHKDLSLQFDLLENSVEQLNQPIVMLNVLHNRTVRQNRNERVRTVIKRHWEPITTTGKWDSRTYWCYLGMREEATMSKANNLYVLDEQAQQCLKDGINILWQAYTPLNLEFVQKNL